MDMIASNDRFALTKRQNLRVWQFCIVGSVITLLFVFEYFQGSLTNLRASEEVATPGDFRVFWAAAKLAFNSQAELVFDNATLNATHLIGADEWMPWLYPPGYLMMLTPMGALDFGPAWILFSLISIAAVSLAFYPVARSSPPIWIACSLAPAYATSLIIGQNSILWIAGFVAAMWALENGKPVKAGIFIGLLTLKPQLGIMIPIALIASGAWTTVISAIATTIAVTILPTLIYGLDYWAKLADNITTHSHVIQENIDALPLLVSVFTFLTSIGIENSHALMGQWACSAIVAAIVFFVWKRNTLDINVKIAALLSAILISGPYLWVYETALFVPLAFYMIRARIIKLDKFGAPFAFSLWLAAFPITLGTLFGFDLSFHGFARNYLLAIIVLSLFLTTIAAFRSQYHSTANNN